MKKILISAVLAAVVLGAISCNDKKQNTVLTKEVSFKKEGRIVYQKSDKRFVGSAIRH